MKIASWFLAVVIGLGSAAACGHEHAVRRARLEVASVDAGQTAAMSAAARGGAGRVGPDGGAATGGGARVVVPPGALAVAETLTVERAAPAELASWPRGTILGFAFTPPELRFRVPVTIELPHDEAAGEVMCQEADGERITERFEGAGAAPFRLHLVELPARCAVYSREHMEAREASKSKAEAIVAKQNAAYQWPVKGSLCDPREIARPNAGKDLREPPGVGGCPAGMAPIPGRAACVDRWEAHVVEILEDGTERTWSPYFNPAGIDVRAKSAPGAVPQGYVSQVQAADACKNAGKRLCADDEWLAACRGSKGTPFPYGEEERLGTCNDHRDQHPAAQYLATSDTRVFTKLEHPCLNQLPDSLSPTGEKSECRTPEGVFDIVGNLHEWTADPTGTFRGGFYVETSQNGRGCDYATTAHEPGYWDYSTGFRCCADAP